jgi:2'-5' RNA ligase
MPDLRLFYACPLPESIVSSLIESQMRLRRAGWKGRFTERTGWHVTLLFLGATAPELLPDLLHAGEAAARAGRPALVHVRGLTAFPSSRQPRVVAAELDDGGDIPAQIRAVLTEHLHVIDDRAFRPHVTLLRVGQADSAPRLPPVTASAAARLDQLVLYESTLLPTGACYEARGVWALSAAGGVDG